MGAVLARGASALDEPPVPAPATTTASTTSLAAAVHALAVTAPMPSASANAAPPSASASVAGHDDDEHEEPHAADNQVEDTHPSVVRVAVPSRDGMLHLPGGHYTMGSSSAHAPSNEHSARSVTVAPFWIDRTEVTVGAYRACVESSKCSRPARASASCTYDAGDPELPISCVHWHDADAYCRGVGKRLPTEHEWEFAARGTFPTPYPWGGVSSSCGNAVTLVNDQTGKSCTARPARVGSHPSGSSVFGVADLSGNVEEWTSDWYSESFGAGPAPRAGAAHVLRGGGWLSPPSLSRTISRNWGSAVEAGPNVGFRCARE